HEVEEAVVGIDDDGAGGMLRLISHRLRQELRVELAADNAVGPHRHRLDVALPDGVPARLDGALMNCRWNGLPAGRARLCGSGRPDPLQRLRRSLGTMRAGAFGANAGGAAKLPDPWRGQVRADDHRRPLAIAVVRMPCGRK